MQDFVSSFLGSAYEGAFKLGFLHDLLPDYERFKRERIFEPLRAKYLQDTLAERFGSSWEKLEGLVPERLNKVRELGLRYSDENLLWFLFLTGYWQGHFFRRSFEDEKIELIKYHLGEDSSIAGAYPNADLMFMMGGVLYVVEFKLAGAQRKVELILSGEEQVLPFRIGGLPVSLSLGELDFEKLVMHLLNVQEELEQLEVVSPEIKGFVQVVSYAADYLCEREERPQKGRSPVSEVCLCLFYPLAEAYMARFRRGNHSLREYREQLRQLHKEMRNRQGDYGELKEQTPVRVQRKSEEIQQQINKLEKEMKHRHSTPTTLRPGSIRECRAHVKEILNDFFQKLELIKGVALLHSPGSGKTSAIREKILNQAGRHIVLYCATRKVLIDREHEKLRSYQGKGIEVVYETRTLKCGRFVEHQGDTFNRANRAEGVLKRTVDEIRRLTEKNEIRFIWALVTQQALTETNHTITLQHLRNLLSARLVDSYQFHFILDEFMGHSNGLYAITGLMNFLEKLREYSGAEGRASLYLLDANAFSLQVLEKLLREYEHFQAIPEALVLCDYLPKGVFELKGICIYGGSRHGYPAPEILLHRNFMQLPFEGGSLPSQKAAGGASRKWDTRGANDLLAEQLADYIQKTLRGQENRTAFVFLQYKELLAHLEHTLRERGYRCLLVTSDSRKSQSRINEGDEDILLATSTLSRGIDLARPHKPISTLYMVVLNWGIERNLVELLQAISRARGDKQTEKEPKHLHLIYPIYPTREEDVEAILAYLEENLDKNLLKQLMEKHALLQKLNLDDIVTEIITRFVADSDRSALIPIPSQFKSQYVPNDVGDWEGIASFIENIALLENDQRIKNDLQRLKDEILQAMFLYVLNVEPDRGKVVYHHPYILLEKQRVDYGFDNRRRGQVKRLFEKVKCRLKQHNPEKTELLSKLIESSLPVTNTSMSVLLPVYGWVLTQHFMQAGKRYSFSLSSRVGRGGAQTLIGSLAPRTYCGQTSNGQAEYPCIPLGEAYPYRDVFEGRSAKFPVEFVKNLLTHL